MNGGMHLYFNVAIDSSAIFLALKFLMCNLMKTVLGPYESIVLCSTYHTIICIIIALLKNKIRYIYIYI